MTCSNNAVPGRKQRAPRGVTIAGLDARMGSHQPRAASNCLASPAVSMEQDTVGAKRFTPIAITADVRPISSCLWVSVHSSLINIVQVFPTQHSLPNMMRLVFERAPYRK